MTKTRAIRLLIFLNHVYVRGVNSLTSVKAVLFDLHGTVAYLKDRVTETELSEYFFGRGYEISPQQLRAAWAFVAFIDYPKYGYKNWRSFFTRILWRLKAKVDNETLNSVVTMLEGKPYELYPDAAEAIPTAKMHGFKTTIVTTIARFQFKQAIQPIKEHIDFIMTGYEAGCDKSNPKMYLKVLDVLNVKPQEAIMVGDDVQLDILLPRRLGINAILLDRKGESKDKSVDAFVYDLNQAMETIISKYAKS